MLYNALLIAFCLIIDNILPL